MEKKPKLTPKQRKAQETLQWRTQTFMPLDRAWKKAKSELQTELNLEKSIRKERENTWRKAEIKANDSEYKSKLNYQKSRRENATTWKETKARIDAQERLGRQLHKQEMHQLGAKWLAEKRLHEDLKGLNRLVQAEMAWERKSQWKAAERDIIRQERDQERARRRAEKQAEQKANGRSGKGGKGGHFGGFAFGMRYGILDTLGAAGPVGAAAGWGIIAVEEILTGFVGVLGAFGAIGTAAAMATKRLGDWYEEIVSFNQQANIGIEAVVGGDPVLTEKYGDYLRRVLARETPFSTRETLTLTPRLQSMGRTFPEANALTQAVSDLAFGLNPDNSHMAVKLGTKLFNDVIAFGALRGEELRQSANLGMPSLLVKQAIKNIWNSEDFQKANPQAGRLRDTAAVEEKIRDRQVSANVAINAFQEVIKWRLNRGRIGEYSQWATMNTISGLKSQLESLPIEIGDMVERYGKSAPKVLGMYRSMVERWGSNDYEQRAAMEIDRSVSAFTGFGTGFANSFGLVRFLDAIADGIEAVDWKSAGMFAADALHWLGDAFTGVMQGLGDKQPGMERSFRDMFEYFDTAKMRQVTGNILDMANGIIKMGDATSRFLSLLAIPGGFVSESMGAAYDWMGDGWQSIKNTAANLLIKPLGDLDPQGFGAHAGAGFMQGFRGKDGIDAHSPSRKMIEAGRDITAGIELGTQDIGAIAAAAGRSFVVNFTGEKSSRSVSSPSVTINQTIQAPPGSDLQQLAQMVTLQMTEALRGVLA